MRTARQVVESPHFAISEVACSDDHVGWSKPEPSDSLRIVLVRQGRFRRSSRGRETTIDPTTGYLQRPGDEERFSHPAGGDLCTSIALKGDALTNEPWLRSAVEDTSSPEVRVDARVELALRMLMRSAAEPEPAAAEALLDLLALSLRGKPVTAPPGPGRRELAEQARDAIVAGVPSSRSLVRLAKLLGTSPSHLSRTFRHHIGSSVSQYRNRVRISHTLAHIDDGESDLAGLAANHGFSDQAHLSRVMRDAVGKTPGQIRALLAQPM